MPNNRILHRFRWHGFALVLLISYLVAGFVVAPHVLKNYLTGSFAQKTGYTVTVGDVELNPVFWRLHIADVSMMDANNKKLLAFADLQLNYDGLSWLRGEYGIESLTVDKPYVDLAINAQGEVLLATVLARLADNGKTSEASASMPALLLEQLNIHNGVIDLGTAQLGKPYRQQFIINELGISDFHTLEEQHANRLLADITAGPKGKIKLAGSVSLARQQAQGELHIEKFDIQPLVLALDLPFDAYLAALPADVSTAFTVIFKDKLALQLQNSTVRLHDIRLSQTAESPLLADIPLLQLQGINIDLARQKVAITSIAASDGKLQLAVDKAGQTNWQALLRAHDGSAASASGTAKPAEKAWQLAIQKIQVTNHALQLHSELTATPLDMALSPINISLQDWQLDGDKAFPVQVTIGLPEQGMLTAEAQVQQQPVLLTGKATLQSFALALAQPYVDDIAYMDIKKGTLGGEVNFTIGQQEQWQVQANGNLQVNDFDARKKGSKKKLVAWQTLSVPVFAWDKASNHLQIDAIEGEKMYGRFIITENGESNLQRLLVETPAQPAAPTAAAGEPAEPAKPLAWDIARITIHDSDMGFSDLSLQPSFKTSIKNLGGQITHISSRPDQQATVKLKGKVDEYAPVSIAGTFSLSVDKPKLDMVADFKNIELTAFTPYSGVYAGYVIDKGQLSMELQYKLVNNRIKGKNHVVINQLVFGKKVESTKVIDLPLKLAIALLSDENGVIDLGFDVKGNINEPKFSINKVIWKALFELLKKTVTAPFTYLGGLLQSDQKNLQELGFLAGSEEISADTASKLASVAKFMQQKQALQLNIQGNALPAVDKPALQEKELLQILATETRQAPELFLPRANPVANTELYDIVADYYHKQRAEKLADIENQLAQEWQQEQQTVDKAELKKAAYAQAWETLIENTPVTADDINELAMRRAQQAKALLVEQYSIDAGRIFVMDSKSAGIEPALVTRLTVDAR